MCTCPAIDKNNKTYKVLHKTYKAGEECETDMLANSEIALPNAAELDQ